MAPQPVLLLKGHSGAELRIETVGSLHFVRKKAATAALNERLRTQAAKQEVAIAAGIPCPRVIGRGTEDDCFYFDMEYLPSISVAQMLVDSVPFDRAAFFDFVERILRLEEHAERGYIPVSHFTAKIEQVFARCKVNVELGDLLPAVERIAETLLHSDWSDIPLTDCHGDFTLENILFNKDRGYFLIDFDQVDLSSYYLDAAKLFQDLWGHWCLRELAVGSAGQLRLLNASLNVDALRIAANRRLLVTAPALATRLLPMVLLHLFRVLPYCHEQRIAVFVVMRINQILAEAGMRSESTLGRG